MEVVINNETYKVNIIKKNIRHMYLRVKSDLEIYITVNQFVNNNNIIKFIESNNDSIIKMIDRQKRKLIKEESFYLLGKKYDIVICSVFDKPKIEEDKIFVKELKQLDKIYKETALEIFKERLNVCYNLIKEIPYPQLRIRKMKRKWGYCNKKERVVTLNLDLIKYGIDEIDYVIIHELCHLIYFDHSVYFWNCVKKYKPNYKENRKVLKEE